MSGALEKFGIYDFMGIWGPGAIAVTYFLFTLEETIEATFLFFEIKMPIKEELYLLIILYSAVAYVIGVIMHELGKLLAERTEIFKTTTVEKIAYGNAIFGGFGWRIKKEYKNIIENTICACAYRTFEFNRALSYLKYTDNVSTKRVDTYHSVYGMSRSLFLCFSLHALVELVILLFKSQTDFYRVVIVFIDLVLAYLFLNRAYRYFCAWIRNVFIQYYEIITKNV